MQKIRGFEMNLNNVLQTQITKKARITEDNFHKEFNALINKYKLDDDIKWRGLNYLKPDKNKKEVSEIIFEHFMALETEKFLSELNRLESYFEKKEYY